MSAGVGHNSEVNASELRAYVERIERLEEEKKALANDIKDIYGEAKSHGFDDKAMREVVRLRKMDRDTLFARESVVDVYRVALGLA